MSNIRLTLNFLVNGEEVPVVVDPEKLLGEASQFALEQSHNTGRPLGDWDVRDTNGTYLDPNRKIEDYRFEPCARLFLSLRVGAGGESTKAFTAMRELIEKHKMAMDRVIAPAWLFRELGVVLPNDVADEDVVEFEDGEWGVVL